jgi:hypothetical protein
MSCAEGNSASALNLTRRAHMSDETTDTDIPAHGEPITAEQPRPRARTDKKRGRPPKHRHRQQTATAAIPIAAWTPRPLVVSVPTAAILLECSESMVWKLIRLGKLEKVMIGNAARVTMRSIDTLLGI